LPNEPSWLPADLIISFNELVVADTGEPHVLRDEGALENALAKPKNYWAYGERDAVRIRVRNAQETAAPSAKYLQRCSPYVLPTIDIVTGRMVR